MTMKSPSPIFKSTRYGPGAKGGGVGGGNACFELCIKNFIKNENAVYKDNFLSLFVYTTVLVKMN